MKQKGCLISLGGMFFWFMTMSGLHSAQQGGKFVDALIGQFLIYSFISLAMVVWGLIYMWCEYGNEKIRKKCSVSYVQDCLSESSDINEITGGFNLLMLLFFRYEYQQNLYEQQYCDTVNMLIEKGIDCDFSNAYGNIVNLISSWGSIGYELPASITENILKQNIAIKRNDVPMRILYPLEIAIIMKKKQTARLLMENGAEIKDCRAYPEFLFIELIRNGDIECAQKFLPYVDVNFLKNKGSFPYIDWEIADLYSQTDARCPKERMDVEKLIHMQKKEHDVTPLMVAAQAGNKQAVEFLLAHEADKNIKNSKGKTAYDFAAANNHAEILELLKPE